MVTDGQVKMLNSQVHKDDILDDVSQLIEALGHKGSRLFQSFVLSHCSLRRLVSTSSGVAKLDLNTKSRIQSIYSAVSI